MQTDEPKAETFRSDQSQDPNLASGTYYEEKSRTSAKQEVINESRPCTSRILPGSADVQRITPSGLTGSSELIRTMSRTEAVKQDVRRLKSMTLGRMGKMFKTSTPVVGRSSLGFGTNVTNVNNYDGEQTKKEKTNSLGRILKLVEKDGSPKKLFVRPRAGSLSRILRRHPHNEDNRVIDKSAEDSTRRILSRILNQLRGK